MPILCQHKFGWLFFFISMSQPRIKCQSLTSIVQLFFCSVWHSLGYGWLIQYSVHLLPVLHLLYALSYIPWVYILCHIHHMETADKTNRQGNKSGTAFHRNVHIVQLLQKYKYRKYTKTRENMKIKKRERIHYWNIVCFQHYPI